MNKNEIVLFETADNEVSLQVQMQDETVWLTANQMAQLFERDEKTLRKHINNVFSEGEVDRDSNTQKMRVAGVSQPVAFYNLDVIISVGYRVKSQRGVEFRRWANSVLKDYILRGYAITVDIREQIEDRLISQLEKRLTTVADRYFDDLDVIIGEIMEYNRENGYLLLLLIPDGSSSFLYRVSNIAIELLTSGHNLSCDDCETITRLYMYHFAGLSMLIRQMKKDASPYDEDFEEVAKKLGELLRPVVYNGILPVIKEHIKD